MAFTQTRKSLIGGDLNTWGAFQQGMDKLHIGANTIEAYISAGALYLSAGMLGIYDGSQDWNVSNSAAAGISVAGLTVSCWAQLEISVVAGVPAIAITSIGGATNPASLPASFTGAYDGTKGGFYITGTKRCHSLIWINAAGVPEGVINTIGGHDGYVGYAQSDDANDYIYSFLKLMNQETDRVIRPGLAIDTPFATAGKISSTKGIEAPEAIFCEEQNAGTNGGTFTTGADQQRVINTIIKNTIAGCSLAANVITIPANGIFKIKWSCPAFAVNGHHSWLANNAGGAILTDVDGNNCLSGAEYSGSGAQASTRAGGEQIVATGAAPLAIKIMHRCVATQANNGFGTPMNVTFKERYSQVWITRLA
jgi:hypothetical protein